MNWTQFIGAIELGLLYSLITAGVYLSFRVLQFPDLSVDGSFPLGAAVCAALVSRGVNPYLATSVSILAGAMAGWVTAFLTHRLRMMNLLSGILVMSALYSVNLRVMGGRPNISLLGERTIFSEGYEKLEVLLAVVIVLGLVWRLFFSTQLGLAIRAAGTNSRVAASQGIRVGRMVGIGLSISNGMAALGGALFCQAFGFADVTLGIGTIIIGLASVMIGEAVVSGRTMACSFLICILGAILYRVLIAFALNLGGLGLEPTDLNLVTALLVIGATTLPRLRRAKI